MRGMGKAGEVGRWEGRHVYFLLFFSFIIIFHCTLFYLNSNVFFLRIHLNVIHLLFLLMSNFSSAFMSILLFSSHIFHFFLTFHLSPPRSFLPLPYSVILLHLSSFQHSYLAFILSVLLISILSLTIRVLTLHPLLWPLSSILLTPFHPILFSSSSFHHHLIASSTPFPPPLAPPPHPTHSSSLLLLVTFPSLPLLP